ncbi:MAG: B12-binding domain-containing radical SAM protein, partial [Peptococcaceae bacterium]|nr:B12-binding domain-containing radical SAM protein [Peptococcaceae bacterium]
MREWIEDYLLNKVEKPLRYQGNEMNVVKKDWEKTKLHLAFAFPDIYEIGMSHLGLSILYHQANEMENCLMERVFAPWSDMESLMRQHNIPLFSLESYRPLKDFHGIGFTLQYEMSYSNILNMLDLAHIPLRWWERSDEDPIIFMGGPCAYNPEPLADFADFFLIGEGEEMNLEVYAVMLEHLEKHDGKIIKTELLDELVSIGGVYIPRFYDVTYHDDGTIAEVKPNHPQAPAYIQKRYLQHMDKAYFPTEPIVPYLDVVHNRAMLEVQRGCTRGCRFCQ